MSFSFAILMLCHGCDVITYSLNYKLRCFLFARLVIRTCWQFRCKFCRQEGLGRNDVSAVAQVYGAFIHNGCPAVTCTVRTVELWCFLVLGFFFARCARWLYHNVSETAVGSIFTDVLTRDQWKWDPQLNFQNVVGKVTSHTVQNNPKTKTTIFIPRWMSKIKTVELCFHSNLFN
jgi:hypothetical protein